MVLCGGSGTRLWPLSRALYPKQLLALASERTLLEDTLLRTADTTRFARPIVVGSEEHRFVLAEQLRGLGIEAEALVAEPVGRNTAPAAAVAALLVERIDPDGHLLLMPADHVIADPEAFRDAVARAQPASADGRLVTFGIEPTEPHTGYGYIRRGAPLPDRPGCHRVERFVEKPDVATAAAWLASGDHLWNSGIFLFRAARYLAELARREPAMLAACRRALDAARHDLGVLRLGAEAFAEAPANSIDYAVMEHADDAVVVPVSMGWSDVGSWAALWRISDKDQAGNVRQGPVIALDVADSLLRSDGPAIAAVGLRDIVLVATKDAVLAVSRDRAEDVRAVVDHLRAQGRAEHLSHPVVHRPWGSYETTDQGHRFRVKRLIVNPGQKLSLQMPPAARRALGGGAGHRAGRARRRGDPPGRERVDLHSERHGPSSRESRDGCRSTSSRCRPVRISRKTTSSGSTTITGAEPWDPRSRSSTGSRSADAPLSGSELARRLGCTRTAVWKHVAALRRVGYAIAGRRASGYRLMAVPDRLGPAELAPHLAGSWRRIEWRAELDSTQRLAAELARAGAEEGTAVIAEQQTRGPRPARPALALAGRHESLLLDRAATRRGAGGGAAAGAGRRPGGRRRGAGRWPAWRRGSSGRTTC